MARERVSLTPESADEDDDPIVTSADELRDEMDKSHMPPEAPRTERAGERVQERDPDERERDAARDELREEAVQRIVDKLREKGKSEAFIEEHMDKIREQADDALYGQDRR